MPSDSAFEFGLTVLIRGGWRVELSWRRLRQKSAKRSHTSSSHPTASEWTDATKDTLPTPAPPSGEEYDVDQKVYHLPIPSWKSPPEKCERDDNDNEKYEKVIQSALHLHPLLPTAYDIPIPYRNWIPNYYERDDDEDEKYDKVKGGDILVIEAG